MRKTSLISALALAAGLTLSGNAFAQVTIGGATVPESDVPTIRAQCVELQTSANSTSVAAATSGEQNGSSKGDDSQGGGTNAQPSGADQSSTTFDLETLTLDQCQEAGLLEGGAGATGTGAGATGGGASTSGSSGASTSGSGAGTGGSGAATSGTSGAGASTVGTTGVDSPGATGTNANDESTGESNGTAAQ